MGLQVWPPPYRLRPSKRAKQVLLKITPQHGLEIVVPIRYRHIAAIPTLLTEQRAWIEPKLARLAQFVSAAQELPHTIELLATGRRYTIEYQQASHASWIEITSSKLKVMAPLNDCTAVETLLRQWLLDQGRAVLPDLLHTYSQQCNLPFSRVQVRLQKTRWGSCNAAKAISLNASLLLLPLELVRYVLIHELCHTIELNHSSAFWQLVAKYDADWQQHRRQLRIQQKRLPIWAST